MKIIFCLLFSSFFGIIFFSLQDEARKKAASTYLVDNTDLPPPRYQQDGTMPTLYPNNMGKFTHTLTLSHTMESIEHKSQHESYSILYVCVWDNSLPCYYSLQD